MAEEAKNNHIRWPIAILVPIALLMAAVFCSACHNGFAAPPTNVASGVSAPKIEIATVSARHTVDARVTANEFGTLDLRLQLAAPDDAQIYIEAEEALSAACSEEGAELGKSDDGSLTITVSASPDDPAEVTLHYDAGSTRADVGNGFAIERLPEIAPYRGPEKEISPILTTAGERAQKVLEPSVLTASYEFTQREDATDDMRIEAASPHADVEGQAVRWEAREGGIAPFLEYRSEPTVRGRAALWVLTSMAFGVLALGAVITIATIAARKNGAKG